MKVGVKKNNPRLKLSVIVSWKRKQSSIKDTAALKTDVSKKMFH